MHSYLGSDVFDINFNVVHNKVMVTVARNRNLTLLFIPKHSAGVCLSPLVIVLVLTIASCKLYG